MLSVSFSMRYCCAFSGISAFSNNTKAFLASSSNTTFAKECKQVLERAEQEAKDKTPEELIEEAGLTVADGDTVSALNGVL